MKLHIHNSLNDSQNVKSSNIFSSKNNASSYNALGVTNGPIKIGHQKIKISTKNSKDNTAKKLSASGQKQLTGSS